MLTREGRIQALARMIARCEEMLDSGRHVNTDLLDREIAEHAAEIERLENMTDSEFQNEEQLRRNHSPF